jgi:hypothetical protein
VEVDEMEEEVVVASLLAIDPEEFKFYQILALYANLYFHHSKYSSF